MLSPNGNDAYDKILNSPSLSLRINQAAQVGDARRQATSLAQKLGFDDTLQGKVALVVTEAANNLVKHGSGGELLLTATVSANSIGLDILALDNGPGMVNVAQCLTDGYSTSGTPGTGLGAIQRLSSAFDIYSQKGQGTVLYARLEKTEEKKRRREEEKTEEETGNREQRTERETSTLNSQLSTNSSLLPPPSSLPAWGAVCVPVGGETESGDGWAVQAQCERICFLAVDGLGHGPQAAEAAQAAMRVFRERAAQDGAQELLESIHAALRGTRGAAAAVAVLDTGRQELVYAGIGNIAGAIVAGTDSHNLVSLSGIVGHQMRRAQTFTYACPSGALLILHSDGLTTQWRLDRYPGLIQRAPAVIAGILYRDCKRGPR